MNRNECAAPLVRGLFVGVTATFLLGVGGCGSASKVDARTTTVGQELEDLEEARNKGLLTEEEYSKQRHDIMKHK